MCAMQHARYLHNFINYLLLWALCVCVCVFVANKRLYDMSWIKILLSPEMSQLT